MRRRECISLLGGAAAVWPRVAHAQPAGKAYRIGYLGMRPPTPETLPVWEAFLQGIREGGYVEGENLIIERRYAEGKAERMATFASEFVRLKVDVIVAQSTPGASAAKQATSTIPIVMVVVGDPIGTGLVASLAHPGGNVTGPSEQAAELGGKQLGLLHEVAPGATRVGVIWHAANAAHLQTLSDIEIAGRALKIEIESLPVRTAEEVDTAFDAIVRRKATGLIPLESPIVTRQPQRVIEFAARNQLPAVYPRRSYVNEGGLMSYGPSLAETFRRAAGYVSKILKGAAPGDLPVQQPTIFELVINLKTAKALGLTVPPSLSALAETVE
jgi:putative ABC transport system substrate-binding protein